jgi:hypothetical protein
VTRLATEVVESPHEPHRPRFLTWVRNHQRSVVLACYLLGGFYVTSRIWIDPVGRRQWGDTQDVNQATWFMRYTATAIEHFRLPALITGTMDAPHGVNLMWNTSLLLPGSLATPFTLLFGPQVSLTVLLVAGFAGSAASMFYVLRRWQVSMLAAALGGALYGFSPALVNSGVGHYSLVLAILPPLMIDRLLRIVTGEGSQLRNGLWLGALAAAQLFTSEELLVDTAIAAAILLAALVISRPRQALTRVGPSLIGLGTAVVVALVLSARGLWVQFHGVASKGAAATVVINYNGRLTNLGTLPYAFVTPGSSVVLHSSGTAWSVDRYPQPLPEYLAYLGVPLIILLLAAIIYFWRNLTIRVAGITCVLLEWLAMGARQINPKAFTLPGFLLPWQYVQRLPVVSGMVPDRLCILADGAAAIVLAVALDLARKGAGPFGKWENGSRIATGVAVVALLFVLPAPYVTTSIVPVPRGYQATFAALRLAPDARVLLAPFPYSGESQTLRWQAETGYPVTMIGGDFIAPDETRDLSRAGRSGVGLYPTGAYLDFLYTGDGYAPVPTAAQFNADLALMKPAALVAVASPSTPLGRYLIGLFGPPLTSHGRVMGWLLKPGQQVK